MLEKPIQGRQAVDSRRKEPQEIQEGGHVREFKEQGEAKRVGYKKSEPTRHH